MVFVVAVCRCRGCGLCGQRYMALVSQGPLEARNANSWLCDYFVSYWTHYGDQGMYAYLSQNSIVY